MEKVIQIGLLSENKEVFNDVAENHGGVHYVYYRNIDAIKKEECTLLLVDCSISEQMDSLQFFLSKIRKKIHELPVLLIVRTNSISLLKNEWFFHDFILYPFRKNELTMRIDRLLHQECIDENIISIGHVRINLNEYSVYLNDLKLELTYKEFEILRLLVQNKGEVFSRKDLLNSIWGMEYIGGTRTVDVHIRRLRGKLGEEFNTIIETVRNVGYRCNN